MDPASGDQEVEGEMIKLLNFQPKSGYRPTLTPLDHHPLQTSTLSSSTSQLISNPTSSVLIPQMSPPSPHEHSPPPSSTNHTITSSKDHNLNIKTNYSHHQPSIHSPTTDAILDIDPLLEEQPLLSPTLHAPRQGTFSHPLTNPFKRLRVYQSQYPRRLPLLLLLITLFSLGFVFSGLTHPLQIIHRTYSGRRFKFSNAVQGVYSARRGSLSWLREAGDGVYSDITNEGIRLTDLKTKTTRLLLQTDELRTPDGRSIEIESFTVSSDLRFVMIKTNVIKQWRYSTFADHWIFDTKTKSLQLLHPSFPGHTNVSLAQWSPEGHSIAYVHQNDLYLVRSPQEASHPIRLTDTGTATIFNGLCDWVYEEEVFAKSSALWWAPGSARLTYLVLDESAVPNYDLRVYNPEPVSGQTTPYPHHRPMKYPKPGFPNPVANLKVFDLDVFDSLSGSSDSRVRAATRWMRLDVPFDDKDRIVTQVAWVSSHELIARETNRIASREKTAHYDFSTQPGPPRGGSRMQPFIGRVVMDIDFVKLDGGWAEPDLSIIPIEPPSHQHASQEQSDISDLAPGYLDVRIDQAGFRHIAYFSPASASEPIFLTSGQWELAGNINAIDLKRRLIYFVAANPSIEGHVYSVKLPNANELHQLKSANVQSEISPLTNGHGYYSVNWSPFGQYYLLSYEGPEVPWQKILKVDEPAFEQLFTQNDALNRTLSLMDMPQVIYRTVQNTGGDEMNVREMRPHGMDMSGNTKYPVLFRVYGGPNSQVVSMKYNIDWHYYLVSSLDYIVVYVDGRGTGFKGRKYRVPVRNQLGKVEADDVAAAARYYAGLNYVDADRIGVWGWSYGGYLTAKTIESHSSDFSLGMAVAPVTDWRYYDTIYAERYMSTLELNPQGYATSAVTQMEGFKHASFLLAHGSADDNVHFLNSASLLDLLTSAGVEGFEFRMFTDSDHSISTRGAYTELFKFLTKFLINRWGVGTNAQSKPLLKN